MFPSILTDKLHCKIINEIISLKAFWRYSECKLLSFPKPDFFTPSCYKHCSPKYERTGLHHKAFAGVLWWCVSIHKAFNNFIPTSTRDTANIYSKLNLNIQLFLAWKELLMDDPNPIYQKINLKLYIEIIAFNKKGDLHFT